MPINNRIVAFGVKPADQFEFNPNNFRVHPTEQQEAIRVVLDKVGWVGVVIENVRTGRLIDGHERIWQALDSNADVPFVQVDLSEEEENLILATYDPIGYMAQIDEGKALGVFKMILDDMPDLDSLVSDVADAIGIEPGDYIVTTVGDDKVAVETMTLHEPSRLMECPHCHQRFEPVRGHHG